MLQARAIAAMARISAYSPTVTVKEADLEPPEYSAEDTLFEWSLSDALRLRSGEPSLEEFTSIGPDPYLDHSDDSIEVCTTLISNGC